MNNVIIDGSGKDCARGRFIPRVKSSKELFGFEIKD